MNTVEPTKLTKPDETARTLSLEVYNLALSYGYPEIDARRLALKVQAFLITLR
jgi:hypothetical protein